MAMPVRILTEMNEKAATGGLYLLLTKALLYYFHLLILANCPLETAASGGKQPTGGDTAAE